MRVFEAAASVAFEKALVEHMRGYAPPLFEVVSEPGMHAVVRSAVERAANYGFTYEGPIRFLLELFCTLGWGADTDPQLPWIGEALQDQSEPQMLRAQRVYERLIVFLDEVAGPQGAYARKALERVLHLDPEWIARPMSTDALLREMESLYPEKFSFSGEETLRGMVAGAAATAERYSLPGERGIALVAALEFALGHKVTEDPFYPWISKTLADTRILDGNKRLQRLATKARTYAEHTAEHLGAA